MWKKLRRELPPIHLKDTAVDTCTFIGLSRTHTRKQHPKAVFQRQPDSCCTTLFVSNGQSLFLHCLLKGHHDIASGVAKCAVKVKNKKFDIHTIFAILTAKVQENNERSKPFPVFLALRPACIRQNNKSLSTDLQLLSDSHCWGTRTRTRKGRTRICSVTITPYPNLSICHRHTPVRLICGCKGTAFF